MKINLTLLGKFMENENCPAQIMIDTDDNETYLRFLRGPDENGSLTIFLSNENINDILSVNGVEAKMKYIIDLSPEDEDYKLKAYPNKDTVIHKVLYGTLSKYVIQLFAAATRELLYPELVILPAHKKSYFAGAEWAKE